MRVHEGILVGGIVFVILLIVVGAVIAERRRRRLIDEAMRSLGLSCSLEGRSGMNSEAFASLGPFRRLRNGASGVRWSARGEIGGSRITLVEHRYSTGSGKNRHTVSHTIAAADCPATWPPMSVTAENLFHKIAELFGSKDIRVEDEGFNSRWRVKCDNEDFAILVLSPEVQAFLTKLPRGVWCEIGQGALCLAARRNMAPEALVVLASSGSELASLLPPELAAWQDG